MRTSEICKMASLLKRPLNAGFLASSNSFATIFLILKDSKILNILWELIFTHLRKAVIANSNRNNK